MNKTNEVRALSEWPPLAHPLPHGERTYMLSALRLRKGGILTVGRQLLIKSAR